LFVKHFEENPVPNSVVISPDIGGLRRARDFAERLDMPLAVVEKRRSPEGDRTDVFNLIGDVTGKNVIIVDDEIDTAGTLTRVVGFVKAAGALDVIACATHAILSDGAPERICSSALQDVIVSDTVAVSDEKWQRCGCKIRSISVASLLADVIRRIHEGRSVGELFDE
jgi:ribose-phosphate pyrophosphokinase